VLSISQFAISLVFIITALVIYNQFNYFMNYEYGFATENVININLQGNDFDLVKTTLNNVSGVEKVGGAAYMPAVGRNDGTTITKPGSDEKHAVIHLKVDDDFLEVLELKLLAGRNLPPYSDVTKSLVLINEDMVEDLGYSHVSEVIGENIALESGVPIQVIGVVEHFTFHMLFNGRETGPIMFSNDPSSFTLAAVKILPGTTQATIARLEDMWKTIDPVHPLNYEFYDDNLASINQGIFDIAAIVGVIAFLAIVIACLGLLGMSIFTSERRTKEVGIRKVLGAGDLLLVYLLSKEFIIMLLIAVAIAAPFSYYFNNLWLNFLVVKAPFGWPTILSGSFFLLILGLLSIGFQTFKVSRSNPVDTLKAE
jgi:putative ABC transport system permease protein